MIQKDIHKNIIKSNNIILSEDTNNSCLSDSSSITASQNEKQVNYNLQKIKEFICKKIINSLRILN